MSKFMHHSMLYRAMAGEIDPIYATPVFWVCLETPASPEMTGARHKTLRRSGEAPDYPGENQLAALEPGRIVAYAEHLTLSRPQGVTLTVRAAQIVQHIIYRNAVELPLRNGKRVLIAAAPETIEALDVLLQAHF